MAQDVQGMLIRIEATSAQLRQELARAEKAVGASASKIDKELINVDRAVDRAMEAISASVAKARAGLDQLGDNLSSTAVAAKSMTSAVSSAGNASAGAARGFKATAGAVNAAGLSAAQYSQAMRMLPMQLTDVVTSLASGMPVWMVAIQQGGQVRDSFGGIGAAARAAISAINPLTAAIGVAAASIGTLVYAYQGGQGEALAFNRALTLTGNAAGTSVDVLMETASALDQVSGTQRQAAAALAEIVATGKIASDQFANVAAAAMAMEQATGKAVADTVKEFAALADEPAAASAKLNQQYNYLTASVYKQIAALEQQGDKVGAARLAMEEYGNAAKERSDDIEQSLGYIDRALNGLKAGWREMWDAAFDIGRPETLEEKLAGVEQAINQRKNNIYVGSVFDWGPSAEELERQRQGIQLSIQQRDLDAAFISLRAQNAQQEIKAAEEERKATEQRDKSYGSMLASLQQTTALHGQASEVARVRYAIEHGELSKLTEAQKAALLVAAQEADAKEAAAEAGRKSAASLREQKSALDALIAKYDPAAKAQAEYEKGIALADAALLKGKYTTEQYQKVVQGLYADLNKPIWEQHNKEAEEAAAAIKKIDDQLESVRDRLDPARAATKRLTAEKKLLKEGLDKGRISFEDYTEAVRKLDDEYARNQKSTSEWTQWTESALERVDGAFADAWRNIGDGFKSFADSLKNAFRQMLAELAHMAITRKIVLQIGAALGIGGGGSGGILSSLGGGGGGGGFNPGQLLQYGQTAYSMFTGVGPAALAGYQSGGLMGGLQGVGSYYGNLASSAMGTVSGWFGGGAASSAAAAQAAGAAAGNSLGVNAGVYASGGSAAGTATLSAQLAGAMSYLGPIAAIYMGIKGYNAIKDGYDFDPEPYKKQNAVVGQVARVIESYEDGLIKVFGKSGFLSRVMRVGIATAGTVMSTLFGGSMELKSSGIAVRSRDGEFQGNSYQYYKAKKGLLGGGGSEYVYGDMDATLAKQLGKRFEGVKDSAELIFEKLGFDVAEAALDGLSVKRKHIATSSKKAQEKVEERLAAWFSDVGNAAVKSINNQLSAGLEGYTFEALSELVTKLESVNATFEMLNLGIYESSVAGAKLAEDMVALAGGLDAFTASTAAYYDKFFTAGEKAEDTVQAVIAQFAAMDQALPATRQQYRELVESIDVSTEAGRELVNTLMSLASAADSAYTALDALRAGNQAMVDAARANVIAAYQREGSALQATISKFDAFSNSLAAFREQLGLTILATQSPTTQIEALRKQFQSTAARAKLGDESAMGDLPTVGANLANASMAFAASREDYIRELAGIQSATYDAEQTAGRQSSIAQKQLDTLTEQLDALGLINDSVQTLAEAIAALAEAQTAAKTAEMTFFVDSIMKGFEALKPTQVVSALGMGFETLDENVDSLLTQDELKAALKGKASDEQLKALGFVVDTNFDGLISATEMAAAASMTQAQAITSGLAGIQQAIGSAITLAQAQAGLGSIAAGKDIGSQFGNLDLDGDGQLTSGEIAGTAPAPAAPDKISMSADELRDYGKSLGIANPYSADLQKVADRIAAATGLPVESVKGNGKKVSAFARGGFHSGGLRLVGEEGPELEVTGPSRIYSASQTAAMLGGGGDAAKEVRGLRSDFAGMMDALRSVAKHTMQTAKRVEFLERWDYDGLPEARAV